MEEEQKPQDRAAKAREARANKREADPRLTFSPLEREQARVEAAQTPADLREAERIRVEQHGDRPFAGESLGTHGVPAGKPQGKQFIVLHGAVGGHARGATVHESQFPEGADIERLKNIGAIAPLGEEPDEDLDDITGFESAPIPTLTEAAFSESPPTLPRTEGIETSQEEVRDALKEGVGTGEPRQEKRIELRKTSDSQSDDSKGAGE